MRRFRVFLAPAGIVLLCATLACISRPDLGRDDGRASPALRRVEVSECVSGAGDFYCFHQTWYCPSDPSKCDIGHFDTGCQDEPGLDSGSGGATAAHWVDCAGTHSYGGCVVDLSGMLCDPDWGEGPVSCGKDALFVSTGTLETFNQVQGPSAGELFAFVL